MGYFQNKRIVYKILFFILLILLRTLGICNQGMLPKLEEQSPASRGQKRAEVFTGLCLHRNGPPLQVKKIKADEFSTYLGADIRISVIMRQGFHQESHLKFKIVINSSAQLYLSVICLFQRTKENRVKQFGVYMQKTVKKAKVELIISSQQ